MEATEPPALIRRHIRLKGVVQGVGFRPFVYSVATRLGLGGYVLNSSSGVTIEAEGTDAAIRQLMEALQSPPALAHIDAISSIAVPALGESSFSIRDSLLEHNEFVLVSPDVATCPECLGDCTRRGDRRTGYAFTNCTNCGPRYTIVQDIPYDRRATTMAGFVMCPECRAEYENPRDRRFHAQPNACPACGPSLQMVAAASLASAQCDTRDDPAASIRHARQLLQDGQIVAVKGLGGFLLACDATKDTVVRRLRERKRRSDKPFALMAPDLSAVRTFCNVNETDAAALCSPQRPIVILPRLPDAPISPAVAPGNNTLGVMLPYTPLHHLLFSDVQDGAPHFIALVMTSGNLSDEPIVISNQEAIERLSGVADSFLLHNRDIYMRVDDSVVRTYEGRERLIRRSRGYVPQPVDLGIPLLEVLACGAELKNTLCLTKGQYAILSQHIGDLDNYETLTFFRETLANLQKLFRVTPRAVAYDLHPGYIATRVALEMPIERKIGVQHHHAHIVACMAENRIRDKVIGVAFDGTGYGTDGTIWGGEFLVCDYANFERRAHLRPVLLAGGDAVIREPWRAAAAYLRDTLGRSCLSSCRPLFGMVPDNALQVVDSMIERNINSVRSSSCGRLFDAVAALIGLRQEVTFEGQAAIELEQIIVPGIDSYPFDISSSYPMQLDMRPTIEQLVKDIGRKSPGHIAATFHNTLARSIAEVCTKIAKGEHLHRVCLSGGTFQNVYLIERTVKLLRDAGLEVVLHSTVPANDGGISLGQAAIANELLKHGA